MAARQGVSWTVSPRGRNVLRGVAASLVGGTFLAHYLPQTLLLDKIKGVTSAYRKGVPIPIPDSISSLVVEVMREMGMGEEEMGRVTLYTSYGYDFFHAGSTHSSHGAILGVPVSLKWNTVEDFDATGVMVNNEPVPWNTPAGEKLRHCVVLSRSAKKFAIARELAALRTDSPALQAGIPASAMTLAYSISLGINRRLDLYARPRALRICLYTLAGLFGYVVYILCKDMAMVKSEAEGDKAAAAMGVEYAEGGVDFYTNILGRNAALRTLMGADGERLFTLMGNDEVLIRTKHLPYTMRLDYMKAQLKKWRSEGDGGEAGNGGR